MPSEGKAGVEPVSGQGYHLRDIKKGVLGELSKVAEELEEAMDAEEQGNRVMVLNELSDMIGAIHAYLLKKYGDTIFVSDLVRMSEATRRAFQSGRRV